MMLAAGDNSDLLVILSQDLSCVAQDLTLRSLPSSRTAGSDNTPTPQLSAKTFVRCQGFSSATQTLPW